jgi:hypothetical protein
MSAVRDRSAIESATGILPRRSSLHYALRMRPLKSEATKRTKKIKNKILAIPAEAAAIPPKPKTAATSATKRKMTVHRNMCDLHIPAMIQSPGDFATGLFWPVEKT